MRDILREHGVELRLGLIDENEAAFEAEAATELAFRDEAADVSVVTLRKRWYELRELVD